MIELYTWATPNGRKVSIALEELGLAYEVHPIDIGAKEQFTADFLRLNPNNKIPAIVDTETGRQLMESGAILLYLADKTGQLGGIDRWQTLEWLMLQMASIGPVFGQTHHFVHFNPGKSQYAEARFCAETRRLYTVLDKRLAAVPYLAGTFSIADIATFPWVARWQWHGIDWAEFDALGDWFRRVAARPAVRRGYAVPPSSQTIVLPA